MCPLRRRSLPRLFELVLPVVLQTIGCSEGLPAAIRAYDHALYPEAVERFGAIDKAASAWRGASRARYALYRGLALLAVGSRAQALPWLLEAKRALDADPSLLSEDDLGRLLSAWSHFPEPLALDPPRAGNNPESREGELARPGTQVPRK